MLIGLLKTFQGSETWLSAQIFEDLFIGKGLERRVQKRLCLCPVALRD
jgi:hypothetical protein